MFRLLFAGARYFAIGLLLGLLTAPRAGTESRRLLRDKGMGLARDLWPGASVRR